MRLTKESLKKIIKEELESIVTEQEDGITGFLILEEEKMQLKLKGENKQVYGTYKQFGLRVQDVDKLAANKDRLLKTVPGAARHLSRYFDVDENILQNFEIVHGFSFNTTTYRKKAGVVTADR